jgi:hypothetical protein
MMSREPPAIDSGTIVLSSERTDPSRLGSRNANGAPTQHSEATRRCSARRNLWARESNATGAGRASRTALCSVWTHAIASLSALAFIGVFVPVAGTSQQSPTQATATTKRPADYWLDLTYGKTLRSMKEPSLRSLGRKDREATIYRFLWFPTFHDPVSVRFVRSDQGGLLHVARLRGGADDQPGHSIVPQCKSVKLTRAQWGLIERSLSKAKFWTLPSTKRHPFGWDVMDGDTLVVEGVSDGRYHYVVRHSPPGGGFVDLCRAMLFMSGMEAEVRQLWFDYGHR